MVVNVNVSMFVLGGGYLGRGSWEHRCADDLVVDTNHSLLISTHRRAYCANVFVHLWSVEECRNFCVTKTQMEIDRYWLLKINIQKA